MKRSICYIFDELLREGQVEKYFKQKLQILFKNHLDMSG